MTNIFRCKICKTHIITEELGSHICRKLEDIKLDNNKILISDGEKWYPLNLEKILMSRDPHDKSCPDSSTDSKNVNLKYYI